MKEIGGYMDFEIFRGEILHGEGILLNTGRACLQYLVEARKIKKIALPFYCCEVVAEACRAVNPAPEIRFFKIGEDWLPEDLTLASDEWLYVVDYYGQLSDAEILALRKKYRRIILDATMSYFRDPLPGVDTIYTCRKFFGVPDGAILFTDARIERELPRDESFRRMNSILGRFERTASEFYSEYARQSDAFRNEPPKRMSKLTENLLRGIDYEFIRERRRQNFETLHAELAGINSLRLRNPECGGAFLYPLLVENGAEIRRKMIEQKIYVRQLWKNVLEDCPPGSTEYNFAENILPLNVDQRYDENDMAYVVLRLLKSALHAV